jgi:hypothetical protein
MASQLNFPLFYRLSTASGSPVPWVDGGTILAKWYIGSSIAPLFVLFEGEWEQITSWVIANPERSSRDIFRELQRRSSGCYQPAQIRRLATFLLKCTRSRKHRITISSPQKRNHHQLFTFPPFCLTTRQTILHTRQSLFQVDKRTGPSCTLSCSSMEMTVSVTMNEEGKKENHAPYRCSQLPA